MNTPSDLNGKYVNNNAESFLSNVLFENYRNSDDTYYRSVDIVDLFFPTNDSLIISFTNTDGYKTFKIKGETKDNYFEYYTEKERIYLPPLFLRHWISKRRIGKNKDGKLEVHQYYNNLGILFFLSGGDSGTDSANFEPFSKDSSIKLFSFNVDGKWGYKDENDSIIIAPQYDSAQLFENDIAKVSSNGKYGYIDILNQVVIPFSYDVILPLQDSLFRVCKDLKWGLIDSKNNIIASIKYDLIGTFGGKMYNDSLFHDLAIVHKDNKIGFINKKGEEVIPAKYDQIGSPYYSRGSYYRTKLDDKYGYVSRCGVLCEAIFEKADENLRDDVNCRNNKEIVDRIGKYAKVVYQGKSYLLSENGLIYPCQIRKNLFNLMGDTTIDVDFENGFKIDK